MTQQIGDGGGGDVAKEKQFGFIYGKFEVFKYVRLKMFLQYRFGYWNKIEGRGGLDRQKN